MMLYKKTIHLIFLITLFSVTVLVGSTTAGTYTITNLTNTAYNYFAQGPQINKNGDMAWIQRNPETGKTDVYLNDGTGVTNLSNNTLYHTVYSVQINDSGQVAWYQASGGTYDICLYDGIGTLTVSSSTHIIGSMQMSNNGNVVWSQKGSGAYGAYDIWLYNGIEATNLTNNPAGSSYYNQVSAVDPQINDNGHVVWRSNKQLGNSTARSNNIYLYDGTGTINLTLNASPGMKPQINNNGDVVWQTGHYGAYISDIFLYDGTEITNLTNNVQNNYYDRFLAQDPQINDSGHVVWSQKNYILIPARSVVNDVYLYDETGTNNLTNNPSSTYGLSDISSLQINNNQQVVWDQKNGGETSNSYVHDAYIYDGADVICITNKLCGSRNFTYPQINDNGRVVWQLSHMYNNTNDVYLATAGASDNNDNGTGCSGASITNLTNNPYHSISTQAQTNDSGHVVWLWYRAGGDGSGVYLYDGSSTIRLSSSLASSPQVNNNGHVVWSQYNGDNGVYLYDGSSTIRLTSSDGFYPQINDSGHVVWFQKYRNSEDYRYYYDVYLYDGTDVVNLTSDASPSYITSLRINNSGHVVWYGRDGVYLYNGTGTTILSNSISSSSEINDSGHVVWSQYNDNGVYLYDGTDTTKLSSSSGSVQINDSGHVVWSQYNDNDVYLYDGTDTKKLASSYDAYNPQINDNGHVVWIGREGSGSKRDLYFYDGEDITNLTSDFCGRPEYDAKINNNSDVVSNWYWYKDGIRDVYLVSPCIPNTPPVADAGSDQTVEQTSPAGAQVVLDGTGSYDDDGDTLAYTWTGPFGTVVGPVVTVTIPAGTSNASLVVNDGTENSTLDSVIITVKDTTPPHNVVAKLEPVKVRKKHGCFRVVLTAEDYGDASPLTYTAVLKTGTCQEEVSNGDLVRLHLKKKRCRIKHEDGCSDDSSSDDCGTVKFEGPDFTLTTTATDARGNESDSVNAAPPVFGHDGDSRSDDNSGSGHKKKKHHGSDDDSSSGHRKKGKKK